MTTANAGDYHLPANGSEITSDWLEEVLQERIPGARINSVELLDTWKGTGTKLNISVECNDVARKAGLPPRLVIKGRFMPEHQVLEGIYGNEVVFYREIAPHLDARIPRCFFAGSDHERDHHLVVLEDLNCRDVKFQRVTHPVGFDTAVSIVENLARLHARFWESPDFRPGGWLAHLSVWQSIHPHEMGNHFRRQFDPERWADRLSLPRGIGLPRRMRDRETMEKAMYWLSNFCLQGPRTLLHGDHHIGNLYVEPSGEVGMLDWQCPSQGNWAHDFTCGIVTALDIEDRRLWDRALLALYLDFLKKYGVKSPPSFNEALEAFRAQIIYGIVAWVVNPVEWQTEVNNSAILPRYAIAALDYDSLGMVN